MLEVLFNTTLLFKQAFTGVKVAVGKAFTFTVALTEPVQPLLVVAVSIAVTVPEVGYVNVGLCVASSPVPLPSKSQLQPVITSGADTVELSVKAVGTPRHTVLVVKATTGLGETVNDLTAVLVQPPALVTVKVIVFTPGVKYV